MTDSKATAGQPASRSVAPPECFGRELLGREAKGIANHLDSTGSVWKNCLRELSDCRSAFAFTNLVSEGRKQCYVQRMPLIVLCGIPGAGKTTVAKYISQHFSNLGKTTTVINEETLNVSKEQGYKGKHDILKDCNTHFITLPS